MYIHRYERHIFEFIGIWVPSNWNSQGNIFRYHIYSVFMLSMISSFLCTCLAYLLRWPENTEIMVETLLYCIAVLSTYIKMINIIIQRKRVIKMIKVLFHKIC